MRKFLLACFFASIVITNAFAQSDSKPNILWLSTEDIGPHLGCYGDPVARTPNLDKLAKRGLTYDLAWSNYPVCAPARTTIITGLYASSMSAGNMRSSVPLDKDLKLFPQYLREQGYYCTNKSKTDYNVITASPWDESSGKAHYRNRTDPSQPFFAVMNHTGTHESKIRKRPHTLVTDPASIDVPPYHPDLPEVRHDWAQYYDNIATMDDWIGQQLEQLEKSGKADDTIIVFFGDHGSGMPRHKRYAGMSGMHVPLIVYIPEKLREKYAPADYEPGGRSKRPVGFVDFAPTMLSICGVRPPAEMQGRAFMGDYKTAAPEFVYGKRSRMDERIDFSRSISDGRYVYIRNYMPHLPHGQFLDYQQQTPTTAVWNRLYDEGKLNEVQAYFWGPKDFEELYDLEADPHETVNLAKGQEKDLPPNTMKILNRFRNALDDHLVVSLDTEFAPEPITAKFTSKASALDKNLELISNASYAKQAADTTSSNQLDTEGLLRMATLEGPEMAGARHWASIGILIRGEKVVNSGNGKSTLLKMLEDPVTTVRTNAAEALGTYGNEEDLAKALPVLLEAADMTKTDYYTAIWALNSIDRLGVKADPIRAKVGELPQKPELKRGNSYVSDLVTTILGN